MPLTNKQRRAIADLTRQHGFRLSMLLSECKCADCGAKLAEWDVCGQRPAHCAPTVTVVPVCLDCVRRVLSEAL